eukprot:8806152-Pyramimonas_sp.AAC.1
MIDQICCLHVMCGYVHVDRIGWVPVRFRSFSWHALASLQGRTVLPLFRMVLAPERAAFLDPLLSSS